MNTFNKSSIYIALAAILGASTASAANVEVQWQDPQHYRDVESPWGAQTKFQQSIFKELDKTFQKEAARLPADQTLHVTVNNLDLAGQVEYFWHGYPEGLRVIRRVDFPRMELSYRLLGADNKVLKQGEAKLQNLGFQDDIRAAFDPSPLRYEKSLVRDWAQKTFTEQ